MPRSKLEDRIIAELNLIGAAYDYENKKHYLKYIKEYKPDIVLHDKIYIEIKGWFRPGDTAKMLQVKRGNPHIDLRFVFEKPYQKVHKRNYTHAEWAERNGFKWAEKSIPIKWIREG